MISYLKGKVFFQNDSSLCLLVGDIGYKIEVVEGKIYLDNSEKEFFIYTHVREDAIKLFGFETLEEEEFFEKLLTVSSVGPKSALSIMSAGMEIIVNKILLGDLSKIKIKGIGSKTLEKVQLELKEKVKNIKYTNNIDQNQLASNNGKIEEVIEALSSLGFRRNEIEKVILQIEEETINKSSSQDLIKLTLKSLKNK